LYLQVILGISVGSSYFSGMVPLYKNLSKENDGVTCKVINGGNLNTKGVKKTTQIFIELGYKMAKVFCKKSENAKMNMELLGLMVNEPNIKIEEFSVY